MFSSSGLSASIVDERVAHGLDVLRRQAVGLAVCAVSLVVEHGARAECRGEPQVEHRVVGLAVVGAPQHRAGQPLAQHLAVAEPEDGHHLAGVDGLRRADRDADAAQRLDELHQVPGNSVWRKRLRRAGASDGHQSNSLVQAKLARRALPGRTGA